MRLLLPVVLAALLCCSFANGLRILGVFPLSGMSHWVMAKSLMTSLAERGHQVDVITHFPMKKPIPNYTDISVAGSVQTAVNNMFAENVTKFNANNMRLLVEAAGTNTCKLLRLPKIQQLIKNPPKDPPYDVVIVEEIHEESLRSLQRQTDERREERSFLGGIRSQTREHSTVGRHRSELAATKSHRRLWFPARLRCRGALRRVLRSSNVEELAYRLQILLQAEQQTLTVQEE